MKKQHLSGCVKKLLTAPTVSRTNWQVDILQGKYVTRESRVRLTHLTTCKRHCQNLNSPVEAVPPWHPWCSSFWSWQRGSCQMEQLQCLSSCFFLAKQTSIKGVLCLHYIREKCLGILLFGNTAQATKFLPLPFPSMLSAGISVLQQKQTSKQAMRAQTRSLQHCQIIQQWFPLGVTWTTCLTEAAGLLRASTRASTGQGRQPLPCTHCKLSLLLPSSLWPLLLQKQVRMEWLPAAIKIKSLTQYSWDSLSFSTNNCNGKKVGLPFICS